MSKNNKKYDPDSEMLAYIDRYIVGDRNTDAADDSAAAAWAAYDRGEFLVPEWFKEEYRSRKKGPIQKWAVSKWNSTTDTSDLTFGTWIIAVVKFLLVILLLSFVFVFITSLATG